MSLPKPSHAKQENEITHPNPFFSKSASKVSRLTANDNIKSNQQLQQQPLLSQPLLSQPLLPRQQNACAAKQQQVENVKCAVCSRNRQKLKPDAGFWDTFGVWIILLCMLLLGGVGWLCYRYYEKQRKYDTKSTTPLSVPASPVSTRLSGLGNSPINSFRRPFELTNTNF